MSTPPYRRYVCRICGYIYDEAKGDPDGGLVPGTRFEAIPEDWRCPWCGVGKADMEPVPELPPVTASAPATSAAASLAARRRLREGVVIVGGGSAGWFAAEAIRAANPALPITLITACSAEIYPKPRLSAAYGQGVKADELVETTGRQRAASLRVDCYPQTRVRRIDLQRRRVITAQGGFPYRHLVLALGATPIIPDLQGSARDQLLTVNHLSDYRRLRQRLDQGRYPKRVAVLGAGLVGCEFIDDLTRAGHRVTVVDPGERPLARLLPEPLSQRLAQRFKESGVAFCWGSSARALDHCREGYRGGDDELLLTLSDGRQLAVDAVLSAAGLRPQTSLAAAAGLVVRQGIVVDSSLQSTAAEVYALGDCAEVEGVVYGYLEPIQRQAATVASAIASGEGRSLAPFETRPTPIVVKTPSLPLVVCPPPAGASGRWRAVEEGFAFVDGNDRRLGFALAEAATAQMSAWFAALERPLPPLATAAGS